MMPPPPPAASGPAAPASPIQAQGTGGSIRIPPLTPDKVSQYTGLFERQSLQNNQLPGEQARQIFDKSGLPNDTLGRIWALADTEQRGALVLPEFVIAMHLLTSLKSNTLRSLPHVLPAALYDAATRATSGAARQSPHNTGMSPLGLTGSGLARTGSPIGRSPLGPQAGSGWAVTPADKAKFDEVYATLDKANRGYITGPEAVVFFGQSNLSEEALAQVWDLADFDSQGHLTPEGFAIAMYLIRQQRSGTAGPLPSTLPENLVPPSVRNRRGSSAANAFGPPSAAAARPAPPPPQPKSALDDLFGLDSPSQSPAPPAPLATMSTGGSNSDPFAGGSGAMSPTSAARGGPGSSFKPFVPSSSFGRNLTGPGSGDTPKAAPATEDLLEDNDPEASKNITGETTELANLSIQTKTLSKQMQDVQNKRTTTQNELNQTNAQKQNFEQRLAQLRSLYEKEAEDTRSLEEQLRKSRADTQKLQSECMALDGQYRDVNTQRQQISEALQADKQENTNLRERIRVVNGEIAQLKPQIEKLKSEARQQKGLVAINKKQFATTEGERDKLKTEAEGLAATGSEEASRGVDSTSPPPVPATVASPALSTSSANNPFFKRTGSTDIMGVFAPPPASARPYTDKSFDDVFGPSGGAPASEGSSAAAPAPFKHQNTGGSVASGSSLPNTGRSSPSVIRQGTGGLEPPPPPPESRQISSSFLPFPDQAESLSSSRQVSPPASRADGSVADSSKVPADEADTTSESTAEGGADKSDTPGATPTGETPSVSIGEAASKAKADGDAATRDIGGADAGKADPFGNTDQAKAKADFENAFAAFKSSGSAKPSEAKQKDAFDTEFPPISELEKDDESDSDSEHGGFDDDFTPASPEKGKEPVKPVAETLPGAWPETTKPEDIKDVPPAVPSKEPVDEAAALPAAISNAAVPAAAPAPAPAPALTADDIFAAATPAHKDTSAKGVFDELDDEFEGLEEAKEGSADDDFANISRDDFNPVFDSSPPPSQAKSESTAFGNENGFDFVSHGSAAGSATTTQPKAGEAHDWDAIFAGLDSGSPVADAGGNDAPKAEGGELLQRPNAPGRALTEQGEHDDPILKSLTGMGYSRADALAALEKYDYNLEKVCAPVCVSLHVNNR